MWIKSQDGSILMDAIQFKVTKALGGKYIITATPRQLGYMENEKQVAVYPDMNRAYAEMALIENAINNNQNSVYKLN